MKQTFFDLIMQNSTLKDEKIQNKPVSTPLPEKKNIWYYIGRMIAIAGFLYIIFYGVSILTHKFSIPAFSYIEIVELYIAFITLKYLIK